MTAPKKLGKGHNDALRGVTTIPVQPIGTDPIRRARLKVAEQVLRLTGDTEPLTADWRPTDVQIDATVIGLDMLGLGPDSKLDLAQRGLPVEPTLR